MKFKIGLIVLVAILSCFSSIIAQDSETDENPQTQPAKKYSISQNFTEGMTFEKHLKHSITTNLGYGGEDITIEMICNTEISITEVENGKPKYAKVTFLKTSVTSPGERTANPLNVDMEGHWFEGSVNEDFEVKTEKKSDEFPEKGIMFSNDFKIIEFGYPETKVDVGDSWEGTKDLAGIIVFQVPGDYKSKLKLDKVTSDEEGNDTNAQIKLSTDFTSDKDGAVRKLESEGDFAFDLINKRLDSSSVKSECLIKITESGQAVEMKSSSTTMIEYKYKSELKKVEEEPNTPKPVESE